MQLEIAQSTPTAASIARLVEQHYGFGAVAEADFLRRGYNQVYRLTFSDSRRVVVRLCSARPRGGANVAYEVALLEHYANAGRHVARCLPTADGSPATEVQLPEGKRALMLFEYLEGEPTGDSEEDVDSFARGLAALHIAGESFEGPPSAYQLDIDYLLLRPLERLLRAPTMSADLRTEFALLGERLHRDLLAFDGLSHIHCHGDAHGANNFIVRDPQGGRVASFFDFDDAGPGYLAYELAVFPWNIHPRAPQAKFDSKRDALWLRFLSAYREVKPLHDNDLAAIARFMSVRQFWFLGEFAGRIATLGSQILPLSYLARQAVMLKEWESLTLPR